MEGKTKDILISTKFEYLPIEVQDVLNDHLDIVVDDFPNELPLIRSISHHIDLIPTTIFPNKVAYKMTPKGNEEILKSNIGYVG